MVMLILYIATGAFIVGGGLIMVSNIFAPRSRSRYYWAFAVFLNKQQPAQNAPFIQATRFLTPAFFRIALPYDAFLPVIPKRSAPFFPVYYSKKVCEEMFSSRQVAYFVCLKGVRHAWDRDDFGLSPPVCWCAASQAYWLRVNLTVLEGIADLFQGQSSSLFQMAPYCSTNMLSYSSAFSKR